MSSRLKARLEYVELRFRHELPIGAARSANELVPIRSTPWAFQNADLATGMHFNRRRAR